MRSLTSAFHDATIAEHTTQAQFVYMNFSSGAVYACNAGYTITMSGQEWQGFGGVGSIEPIGEGLDMSSTFVRFTISGVDPTKVAIALGQHYQGRECSVWTGLFDSNYKVINEPDLSFKGRMDTMEINLGEQASISVVAEHFLADRDRPRIRRYNHADQQAVYSGDMFFEFQESLVDKEISWGPTDGALF